LWDAFSQRWVVSRQDLSALGGAYGALSDNLFVVGMLHPDDPKAQDALKFIARKNHIDLGVYLVSYGDFEAVMRRYSPYRTEISRAIQALNVKEGGGQKMTEIEGGAGAEDAPIIKIVADTFREAISSKASDIHIEPQEHGLRVRFRIDGDLEQVALMPSELGQPITSRVKVISNLKIDETRAEAPPGIGDSLALLKTPTFALAVLGIFLYVGAEVSMARFLKPTLTSFGFAPKNRTGHSTISASLPGVSEPT